MNLNKVRDTYLKDIERFQSTANDAGGDPKCRERRSKGIQCFRDWGIPHNKLEDWRYTSLQPSLPKSLDLSSLVCSNLEDSTGDFSGLESAPEVQLTFVDGHCLFGSEKLPPGISLRQNSPILGAMITSRDSFEALNWAVFDSVATLEIDEDACIKPPIVVIHKVLPNTSRLLSPHLEIVVGDRAKVSIFELFVVDDGSDGKNSYQRNAVTYIDIGGGAQVEHVKTVVESHSALHISKVKASVAKDAVLNSLTFSLAGGLVRNNIEVSLNEEGAFASVHGLFGVRDNEHHDNFSIINHKRGNTSSRQLFKGILDDNSRGVFTGKIVVDTDCSQVDSEQLNKNLMLSEKAHVDTRPQLEIATDDVKCSHGATTSQISDDEMFYLESRGVSSTRAYKILGHAFAMDVVEKIENLDMRANVEKILYDKFERFSIGSKEQDA